MARYQYRHRKPQRRKLRFSRILTFLVLLLLLAYPFWEATHITVAKRTVLVPSLAPNLKNMEIAYVTDIHQGMFFSQARVNQLINQINALGADIVILGGDYAENPAGAIAFFQNAPRIQARLGVYGVLGANDRSESEEDLNLLVGEMKTYGCIPLVNNVTRVKAGQTYVHIAGADDFTNGMPDIQDMASQVKQSDFVVFVAHDPDLLIPAFSAKSSDGDTHWFDLALFGQTHGGQITVFGRPLLPGFAPSSGLRYLTGWREENRAGILISNGIGTSVIPMRLFAQPQIHLMTLKAK